MWRALVQPADPDLNCCRVILARLISCQVLQWTNTQMCLWLRVWHLGMEQFKGENC